jgi:hypothetical protein
MKVDYDSIHFFFFHFTFTVFYSSLGRFTTYVVSIVMFITHFLYISTASQWWLCNRTILHNWVFFSSLETLTQADGCWPVANYQQFGKKIIGLSNLYGYITTSSGNIGWVRSLSRRALITFSSCNVHLTPPCECICVVGWNDQYGSYLDWFVDYLLVLKQKW